MSEMPSEAPAVSGRRRWKGRLTSLVAVCVIIATVAAVQTLRSSGDRANKAKAQAEITHLLASFETPPGSNLAYTRLKAEEAARVARSHKEVLYTYTTLGSSSIGTVDEGNIYVRLVPKNQRSISAEQFANMLRKETKRVAGVTLSVFTSDFGGGRKQLQMQLRGNDLVALNQAAEMVKEEVARVPGAVDIGLSTKGQKPELNVELNRGVAGSMGITVGEVAQALRPAFAGLKAGDWVDPSGETRDVEVRLSHVGAPPISRRYRSSSPDRTACRVLCPSGKWRQFVRARVRRSSTISTASSSSPSKPIPLAGRQVTSRLTSKPA